MSDDDLNAIRTLEARRCKALADVDLVALEEMFSDQLTHVHTTGLVHDKAGFLAGLAAKRPFLKVERGGLTIRVMGNVAVIQGLMTNTVRRPDQPEPVIMRAYATQVLAKEDGRWRYVAFHASTGPKLPQA